MADRQFVKWCEALAEQAVELDDELFDQPPGPANEAEVRAHVGGIERLVERLVQEQLHDYCSSLDLLVEPLRRQRDRGLAWDRWHVKTAAAIADLASDLLAAGRLPQSPLADLRDQLAMLLGGAGPPLQTELTPNEKQAFQRLLDRS